MTWHHPATLRITLRFIALVQIVLGAGFLAAPQSTARLLGLAGAPAWANWMFGMTAARFLAFGYGMALAARDPAGNIAWLRAMIAIQIVDWSVTMRYLLAGAVTLAQVGTASFLPLVFVALLCLSWPRTAVRASH